MGVHSHGWPRLMKKATAAEYCDMTTAMFEREVMGGTLPLPTVLGRTEYWSRVALDEKISQLAGETVDDWRNNQPGLNGAAA